MFINIILYQEVFQQIYSQFCFDSYSFIFWFFSFDTIKVLMSVCPIVSVFRFYGCCHPCFYIILIFQVDETYEELPSWGPGPQNILRWKATVQSCLNQQPVKSTIVFYGFNLFQYKNYQNVFFNCLALKWKNKFYKLRTFCF